LEPACDRALSIDGGLMWISQVDPEYWQNLRLGGAIRRKWRILDGNVGERSVVNS
jgi:hypothetical protein